MASHVMINSNKVHALSYIYKKGPTTRTELVNELGISPASTMRLVIDLLANGYLVEKDAVDLPTGRGRPSSLLEINPECGVVAGIEFGRESLLIYFAAANGAQIGWCEIEENIPPYTPTASTLDKLIEIIISEAQKFGISPADIRAIGLSVHDLITAYGGWITWDQPLEHPFSAREYLIERYGYFVYVDDVSRTFAFAEHRAGAGRDATDMIYLFVGKRGIGSGIFVNNQLLKSDSGFCGEIGHIQVEEDGVLCQCGNQGCLETVATNEAVLAQIREKLESGVVSSLSQSATLTFADVCLAYKSGDKVARIVLSQLARNLSKALASTISIVGASRILIGGQLNLAGDDFTLELTSLLHKKLIPGLSHSVSVDFAELSQEAGAYGVATQALDRAWAAGYFLDAQS